MIITRKTFIIPFMLGMFFTQKLSIVGETYIGEIFLLIYLCFAKRNLKFSSFEVKIVILGLIWMVAQYVSDDANSSTVSDTIKGIGAPFFFVTSFLALNEYFGMDFRRAPAFLLGITFGTIIYLIISHDDFFYQDPWKWGMGNAVFSVVMIVYSFYLKSKNRFFLLCFGGFFIIISTVLSSRSLAFFVLFSMAIFLLFSYKSRHNKYISFFTRPYGTIVLISGLFMGLMILNLIFGLIFSSATVLSYLPSDTAHKYQVQATGTYGILLGGRSEFLISSKAFLDAPFLGHGSWAQDKSRYQEEYAQLRYDLGYSLNDSDDMTFNDNLIPTHSYIMGAIVWGGIFSGLLWMYVLYFLINVYCKIYQNANVYIIYLIINFIWNILFSPFGADARWSSSIVLAFLVVYQNMLMKRKVVESNNRVVERQV